MIDPSSSPTTTGPRDEHANSTKKKISFLARKRLEKFAALVPRIVVTGDIKTIHDARVWSRRLQQILVVLAPQSEQNHKQRKLMRALRKIRKALGRPRNLDVIMERVQKKLRAAANPTAREAWEKLRIHLDAQRAASVEHSREKLRALDIMDLTAGCRAMIDAVTDQAALEDKVGQSVAEGLVRWHEAIATVKLKPTELHALRITTKRLRYRMELLAEADDRPAKARVKILRMLQGRLGSWHDSQVFVEVCAEFLSRKNFLASYPGSARTILVAMEREQQRTQAAIEGLVKHAETAAGALGATELAIPDAQSETRA